MKQKGWILCIMLWLTAALPALAHNGAAASLAGEKAARPLWIILTIGLLLLLNAIVHASFPTTVSHIVRSYYQNSLFNQIGKGDSIFGTWPSLFLFIILGFSTGMFLFLALPDIQTAILAGTNGPLSYLLISFSVLVLFSLKIGITRLIAYVFGIRRYFRTYIRVLFLAYFNTSYLFAALALILSLIPSENSHWFFLAAFIFAGAMLVFRLAKVGLDLIHAYRFPVFYLIVYLCTLEIAPILILIKIVY